MEQTLYTGLFSKEVPQQLLTILDRYAFDLLLEIWRNITITVTDQNPYANSARIFELSQQKMQHALQMIPSWNSVLQEHEATSVRERYCNNIDDILRASYRLFIKLLLKSMYGRRQMQVSVHVPKFDKFLFEFLCALVSDPYIYMLDFLRKTSFEHRAPVVMASIRQSFLRSLSAQSLQPVEVGAASKKAKSHMDEQVGYDEYDDNNTNEHVPVEEEEEEADDYEQEDVDPDDSASQVAARRYMEHQQYRQQQPVLQNQIVGNVQQQPAHSNNNQHAVTPQPVIVPSPSNGNNANKKVDLSRAPLPAIYSQPNLHDPAYFDKLEQQQNQQQPDEEEQPVHSNQIVGHVQQQKQQDDVRHVQLAVTTKGKRMAHLLNQNQNTNQKPQPPAVGRGQSLGSNEPAAVEQQEQEVSETEAEEAQEQESDTEQSDQNSDLSYGEQLTEETTEDVDANLDQLESELQNEVEDS